MRNLLLSAGFAVSALIAIGGPAQAKTLTSGIDADVTYVQDYFRDIHGGKHRGGGAPGMVNVNATLDGRSWGGSTNDVFYVDLLGTFGGSISNQVGDLQGADNIEAYNTFKVYSAWYQHTFGDSGFSVRLGLQDYNALFDTLDAAGVFINSSFGLDASIAQSNVSQYPTTAVGAVVRWVSPEGFYAMGGVYDGVPGKPGHPAGTHIDFGPHDGVFSAFETGLKGGGDRPFKIGLGGWYQTSDYQDVFGRERDTDHGVYAIAEKRLIGGGDAPALDAFIQLGDAQSDANTLDHYIGAGVDVTGLVPGRKDDVLGLGMARAHTSDAYRRATANASHAETALEMTYQANLNSYAMIQPDVQYIIDPGASHGTDNAWVVGIRGQLSW